MALRAFYFIVTLKKPNKLLHKAFSAPSTHACALKHFAISIDFKKPNHSI